MIIKENIFWLSFSIIIVLSFLGFIIPFLQKKTILFGSRIPVEIIDHVEIRQLKKNYKHVYLTAEIPFLITAWVFLNNFSGKLIFTIILFAQLILMLLIYAVYNGKVKQLKKTILDRESIRPGKEVSIVDTGFRDGKYLISVLWFVPSVLILFANIIILLLSYDNIPERIGLHFNMQGSITLSVQKTFFHVMHIPLNSVFILAVFVFVYYSIKRSKQEIDSHAPETSKLKDRHFRLIWSDYSVIVCTTAITWLFFLSLYMNRLLKIPSAIFELINIAFPLLIFLSAIVLALRTGQSGSKLKINVPVTGTGMNNVNDDRYWKLGAFYFNPKDPAIFVEKRYGVGWTINFGRPVSVAIIIVLAAVVIIIKLLSGK